MESSRVKGKSSRGEDMEKFCRGEGMEEYCREEGEGVIVERRKRESSSGEKME